MLKKILIGVVIFIVLAIGGIGGYIYMMDWNQHKDVVAERFSQITGLKASIEGELKVDLFPSPKFSANAVRFFKNNAPRDPLVTVKEISANVDLWPMFSHKFIIKSMALTNATVNVNINEKGISNWEGINSSAGAQKSNIEVSFNDVRLNGAVLNYKNLQDNEEFSLPNISASISASSIKGPYKTNGKLIYNNSEIKFQGAVAKNKDYNVNMTFENAPTGTKSTINGTLGKQAKGSVSFKSAHLSDIMKVIFGEDALDAKYNTSLDFSFQYDYDQATTKLNNFVVKYGNSLTGSGSVTLNNAKDNKEISANLDMAQLDLNLLGVLGGDILDYSRQGKKIADTSLGNYNAVIDIKAPYALYNGAEVQNVNMGITLQKGLLTFTRMGLSMPGNTLINLTGTVDLNDSLKFQITPSFATDDLRLFSSVFKIDLAKLASEEDKKSIFKRAKADLSMVGDMNHLKIAVPQANIDAMIFSGDLGFVKNEDTTVVIAAIDGSKVLFDKYIQVLPKKHDTFNLKEKFIYQMKLIPWKHDLNVDAKITLKSAVYNSVPLENLVLEFNSFQDNLNVTNLSIDNIAGANFKLNFAADKVYTDPYFNELSYDIKTDNFPQFASILGIKLADLELLKSKLFATQGALSGNFNDLSLSSVQKFGDIEFLYTGTIADITSEAKFDGNIELKSNNFSHLIKALNFDYKPDLPVTTFSLASKIKGTTQIFDMSEIVAYLSANAIKGSLNVDKSKAKPYFKANLDFDRFDADRLFNLSQKYILKKGAEQAKDSTFVNKPQFNDEKINYELLKSCNFKLNATAKSLVYEGSNYNDTHLKATLKEGVLHVSDFVATGDDLLVELKFDLNSNVMPKIDGSYEIKGLKVPNLSGTVYAIQDGVVEASGTFSSLATTPRDFFENMSSKGDFELVHPAIQGWDFALIKFELEQRSNTDGFEDTVLQSLRNGHSNFTRVHGAYEINQGMLVAKKIVWESPVIALNMKLDLNFSNWLFTAIFNGVYHNATFSDVLKFTFDGNLANPEVKADLSESLDRIGNTEKMMSQMKEKQDAAQRSKLKSKIESMQETVKALQQDLSRMELDVVTFKPATDNKDVNAVYDANIKVLKDTEDALASIANSLRSGPTEVYLREIEASLSTEQSKILYIPKALEDNYVVDSKYVFDATFNKIAWLYNVAQNNSAYYKSLSDIYMTQIEPADEEENSGAQNNVAALESSVQKVDEDMNKITELHNKVRDNYLVIIDATKVAEMKENNEIASQALQTLSQYVAEMNQDIVKSFDMFREALDIQAKDYEQYMVYPPLNPDEIDITQPTVRIVDEKKDAKDQKRTEKSAVSKSEKSTISENAPKVKEDATKLTPPAVEETVEAPASSATSEAQDDKKKIEPVTENTETKPQPVSENTPAEKKQNNPALNDILQMSSLGIHKLSLPTPQTAQSEEVEQVIEKPQAVEVAPSEDTIQVVENSVSEAPVAPQQTDSFEEELLAENNSLDEVTAISLNALPNTQSFSLIGDTSAMPSALSKAMHQDIDNNLTVTASLMPDADLSVSKQTKMITEDIAMQLEDIKSQAQEMAKEDDTAGTLNTQKVNPVIAMDMGKTEAVDNSLEIAIYSKKSKFKKADISDTTSNEIVTADVKQDNSQRLTKEVLIDILENQDSHPTLLSLDTDIARQPEIKVAPQYVFAAKGAPLNSYVRGTVGKRMFLGKKMSSLAKPQSNQYIFGNSLSANTKESSGIVGKNIHRGREVASLAEPIDPQYVFAASSFIPSASGEVGKNMFLDVK